MKRTCLLLLFSVCMMTAMAVNTDSKLTITNLELNPGGSSGYLYVGLEGTQIYSGYSMDIYLPDGIDVCLDEENAYDVFYDDDDSDIYPYSKKTGYSHDIKANVITSEDGQNILRILCVDATSNKEFEATTGRLFYAQLKANAYAKPGNYSATIKDIALVTQDGTKYVPEEATCTLTITSSATVSVGISSANMWSTCILPFDTDVPDGMIAYTTSSMTEIDGNEYLVLTKANSIDAYTPYILYAENGFSSSLTGTVDASSYPSSGYVSTDLLNGAIVSQQINEGYVLQNLNSTGAKFYNTNGANFTIPAGKCWLTVPNNVKSFGFVLEDETGIGQIRLKEDNQSKNIYTLEGTQVDHVKQGRVYIINGKKVLILK